MNLRHDYVQVHVVRPAPGGHEFLQLRRAPGQILAGAWAIINGQIEPGEKAWQTAIRELREETGLWPLEFYQLDTVNTFYFAGDDAIWLCPGFCALVAPGAPIELNEEHDAYRWLARDQLERNLIWPGERQAAAELCREILDDGPAKGYLRVGV